jgi:hypothetical protein
VGYAKQEKKVHVEAKPLQLDFQLLPQQLKLNDVVVKSGAEDPAYAIIRHCYKKTRRIS